MHEIERNKELNEKKEAILKESDGVKRAENFIELLEDALHIQKNLFAFFQVKKWLFIEFDQGYKNKELFEKYKILDQEGIYLKNKQIKEADFAIEQMQLALDDLKLSLEQKEHGLKQVLLPRILLRLRPKQLINDLRALRLLSKIRIRLFDFQKELSSMNATISKKKNMFSLFRAFSKQVHASRNELLDEISSKIEASLFKELDKKVCLKTKLIRDERLVYEVLDEVNEVVAIVEAMRLMKSYALVFLNRLDAIKSVCNQLLEKQKQAYLSDKQMHEEKKSAFLQKIEEGKNLQAILQEVQKSSLYIEFKRVIHLVVEEKLKKKVRQKDLEYIESKKIEKQRADDCENKVLNILASINLFLKESQDKPLHELKEALSDFMYLKEELTKRADLLKFDIFAFELRKNVILKEQCALAMLEQKKDVQDSLTSYKKLKVSESLSFDEALELNQIFELLKGNKQLCLERIEHL